MAAALGCDVEKVARNVPRMHGVGAESVDFLDIVFRLERAFEVKIPRAKIVGDARGFRPGRAIRRGLEGRRERERRKPMPDRFSAFSFVDRITALEAGRRARGRFAIPAGLPAFSICLVAEAVAQLAAWVAMAQSEFRGRPVAALAREMRVLGEAAPGDILDLGVEIESCDPEAVAFDGWARVGDTPVLELRRCLGPMLPLEDFDAPEAMRRDFETLCGPSARPGRFRGVEELDLTLIDRVPGQRLRAAISVPVSAPFFADHFPRRPVFPATLLLDAQIRLALRLAGETVTPGQRLVLAKIADMKMRSFILPGQRVEMETTLWSATDGAAELTLAARVDGKRVGTGRVEIVPRGPA